MADEGLTIVDGKALRNADLSLPESHLTFTGALLLDVADSRISSLLSGLSLPDTVKFSALERLGFADLVAFRSAALDREDACLKLRDYVMAIADELEGTVLIFCLIVEEMGGRVGNFWIMEIFCFLF